MALLGRGAVAIWHDIVPEGRDQFYDWHGNEHMLERVEIPGFHRGRRYIAIDADLEFFNLYEAQSLDVLKSPAYQDRLNNPTPWTVDSVKHFRGVNRSLVNVAHTTGRTEGGLCATLRYDVADDDAPGHQARAWAHLEDIAALPEVAGAHLLVADRAASAIDTAERKARGEANRIPAWIAIVEGWGDADRFANLCRARLSADAFASLGAQSVDNLGIYQLQITVADAAVA
ncbi:hypothetical protein L1787_00985 [Acuticoccus sp. M5D2P5]|uniref:hypothetical protein n=1 Tax=Acuticoccus kalidii TaxID=2910977 RepID=UPI001F42A8A5|nr:hypothetical protein [Acuticoccus kalidii]MCF3931986.1 hypothetical protein [Acuticoccus kalidii]